MYSGKGWQIFFVLLSFYRALKNLPRGGDVDRYECIIYIVVYMECNVCLSVSRYESIDHPLM